MDAVLVVRDSANDLHFGPWDQIFYSAFDGRRQELVLVKIIGE